MFALVFKLNGISNDFPSFFILVAGYKVCLNTKAYNKIMLSESVLCQNA